MFRTFVGYSVLVTDVTEEEYHAVHDKFEVQYHLFPSINVPNTCTLCLVSWGYNAGQWYAKTLPALIKYWGEERIIHEVELMPDEHTEDLPPVPMKSMPATTHVEKIEQREQRSQTTRPQFTGNPNPIIPPRRR